MMFEVYAVSEHGNGFVQQLPDWDGEDTLQLRVGMFTADTVIQISPKAPDEEG